MDENNNLKNILQIKVNNIEEKLQRITEQNSQEETFEMVLFFRNLNLDL